MGVKTVYRKAVYASCGLPVSEICYKPLEDMKYADSQKTVKQDLALNSLILFTDIGYKISITLSLESCCISPCRDAGTCTDHVSVLESVSYITLVSVSLSCVEDNLSPTDNCR